MRVCDYIAERLYEEGVRQVYGLVGGGTAGLNWVNSPKIINLLNDHFDKKYSKIQG